MLPNFGTIDVFETDFDLEIRTFYKIIKPSINDENYISLEDTKNINSQIEEGIYVINKNNYIDNLYSYNIVSVKHKTIKQRQVIMIGVSPYPISNFILDNADGHICEYLMNITDDLFVNKCYMLNNGDILTMKDIQNSMKRENTITEDKIHIVRNQQLIIKEINVEEYKNYWIIGDNKIILE